MAVMVGNTPFRVNGVSIIICQNRLNEGMPVINSGIEDTNGYFRIFKTAPAKEFPNNLHLIPIVELDIETRDLLGQAEFGDKIRCFY
jgi:hypothetical protein